jgi:hypothetical protein
LKAAAVVTAAGVAGGVGVVGATEVEPESGKKTPSLVDKPGERLGQTAPRGVLVPGRGVARGKTDAPGQEAKVGEAQRPRGSSVKPAPRGRSAEAKAASPGQSVRTIPLVKKKAEASETDVTPARGLGRPDREVEPRGRVVFRPLKDSPS